MCVHLTEEQPELANHSLPGHARFLAGPGTGKSTMAVALAEQLLSADEHQGSQTYGACAATTKSGNRRKKKS